MRPAPASLLEISACLCKRCGLCPQVRLNLRPQTLETKQKVDARAQAAEPARLRAQVTGHRFYMWRHASSNGVLEGSAWLKLRPASGKYCGFSARRNRNCGLPPTALRPAPASKRDRNCGLLPQTLRPAPACFAPMRPCRCGQQGVAGTGRNVCGGRPQFRSDVWSQGAKVTKAGRKTQ